MKRILLLLSLIAMAWLSKAQTVSVGVRGGLSIPNLSSSGENETPLSKGYSSFVGPGFAVFADFKISDLFSIEPAIEYSAQGGKKDGVTAFPLAESIPPEYLNQIPEQFLSQIPEYGYTDYKSKAKFNYLMIPVLAKFGWNLGATSPWRVYVGAGPFVGFLLNAKQITRGNNEPANIIYADESGTVPLPNFLTGNFTDPSNPLVLPMDADTDIKDDLKKVNVGFEAKAGLAYKMGRSNIFIEGGGNYGFIKIQKDARNGKNNTGAGIVMLGYSIDL